MSENRLIAFLSACLLTVFMVSTQAFAGYDWSHRFTEKSLKGTYYIPCACEGNEINSEGSIHSAGMGKIEFDGNGGATITQHNLYTEIGNKITRVVKDGEMMDIRQDPPVPTGQPAQFPWRYKVDSEGYGLLYNEDMSISPDDLYTPSFMITKARGRRATEIYLILPQNFIDFDPNDPNKHLIHVTATRR